LPPHTPETEAMPQTELHPTTRALLLFSNFLLIILGYYQIKPASRTLFVEYWGAANLPYVWIATAAVLGLIIGYYHRLVERHSRIAIVLGSLAITSLALVLFWWLLGVGGAAVAVVFYVFVDIFSVVLVEQFWSLTNTIYSTEAGKRWYGFVATGGLVGGVLGGGFASFLVSKTGLSTRDLLLVAAAILGLLFVLNLAMGRRGMFAEARVKRLPDIQPGNWQVLFRNRYLLLIAMTVLLSQLVEPITEFQFISSIEREYASTDLRTVYLANFFSIMGIVSIAINIAVTPLVHRFFGVIAGLAAQPLMVTLASLSFLSQPSLFRASVMKIADRGLSYSINRASKEILYIPIDPVLTYQAKAWIDMFGYRLFKVIGSVLILALTQWFALGVSVADLSLLNLGVCGAWLLIILMLTPQYRTVLARTT